MEYCRPAVLQCDLFTMHLLKYFSFYPPKIAAEKSIKKEF